MLAEKAFDDMLPDGLATPDQYLMIIEDCASGRTVGCCLSVLHVLEHDTSGLAFYQSCGYTTLRRIVHEEVFDGKEGVCPMRSITIEEIPVEQIDSFWTIHMEYLVSDGIVTEAEDIAYFQGDEYRGILKAHMLRATDRHHLIYFCRDGERIGAASYCIYQEDGKCFLMDFWVFPAFRGNGTGHQCFEALERYTKKDGAACFELNSEKPDSVRFWKSLGFVENGEDEYGMPLLIKR